MRILIVSDTHRNFRALSEILERHPESRMLLFLGDGLRELEDAALLYPDKQLIAVRGNCDWASPLPAVRLLHLEGTRVLMLHGDQHGVKGGLAGLQRLAAEQRADVVLYGHTHAASCTYLDGVYFLNPGSPTSPRAGRAGYAYLDLVPAGIVPVLVPLP